MWIICKSKKVRDVADANSRRRQKRKLERSANHATC